MSRHSAGATVLLALFLLALFFEPAAAARSGTRRIARDRNYDWPDVDPGGAHADTTWLGSWGFGTPSSCSSQGWTSVDLTAGDTDFGDYAGLLDGRTQYSTELCVENLSCLWGFIAGSTDTYACGGQPGQAVVPYADFQHGYIWNEIQSPLINIAGSGSTFGLRFSVYRGSPYRALIFYTWRVRSLKAGIPGEWTSREFCYYGPMVTRGDWFIQDEQIGALIEPGADQIQVALGVVDMAAVWGALPGDGACHSNAPLFDSVKVYRAATSGPQWSVDSADLFQDNFPTDGTATGTVRMDMARDLNASNVRSTHPGDSMVVSVNEPTVGMGLDPGGGCAVYLHVRDLSAEKTGGNLSGNLGRWPHISSSGGWTTLRFDSVRTDAGPVVNRYCVDLNDAIYTPGDVVEFYFSARDAAGHVTYWTEFTGTTSSPPTKQPPIMEATCLPIPGRGKRAILLVDDNDGSGGQLWWDGAFLVLGIQSEVDRYDVRASDEMVGNGAGSRVRNVDAQLADYYDSIIWSCGNNPVGLIGGEGRDKSRDAAMLVEFIERKVEWGVVYLSGDQIAAELARGRSGSPLRQYIDFDLVADTHSQAGAISPKVIAAPGSTFIHNGTPDSFILFGGCAQLNSFCLLAPTGDSVAEMLYNSTQYAAEVGQSTHTSNGWKWVLLAGFGFEYMRDDEFDGTSDRALHLGDILRSRELPDICGGVEGDIQAEDSGARISWETGTCGAREVRIIRTADWGAANEVIHTAAVPPFQGIYHDEIPFGHSAYYRLEASMGQGRTMTLATAMIRRDVAITSFQAVARDLSIDVEWHLVDRSGIESLMVERRPRGETDFAPAGEDSTLSPETTRLLDTSFTPGRTYEYRLVIRYTGGWSTRGDIASVEAPHAAALGQNVPNPFNPETKIPFLVPSAGHVEIAIFNVNGARVRTLLNGQRGAGYSELHWDGRDNNGSPAASGVYFCRMSAAGQNMTRKIVLVR